MSLHIAQNKCSKAGVVDHLGLRKNTKHYGDAKILFITEGGRNSLSHMLVLVKVAFVSVSYDFLESAPLPRDRGHVCVRREHVFELCTGCPRPLSCSQHVSSNDCLQQRTPLPLLFDFLWISISKATAENGGKCCGQQTPSFRAWCGSTVQASRMYVSCTSSSHTELMPEQSQCEASPK